MEVSTDVFSCCLVYNMGFQLGGWLLMIGPCWDAWLWTLRTLGMLSGAPVTLAGCWL